MTDTTTPPLTDPGPPPPRPSGARAENRFFAWVRGLGIVRTPGWLGGVAGGLAARMGIDPIIVRGMFVVAALIGFPALLLYAVAWALLPDLDDRIPAQQLTRGRFEPVMIGIGIMALLGLVPTVPWLWSAVFWPLSGGAWAPFGFSGLGSAITTLLTIVLVGGIIALIVWLAVRAPHASRGGTVPDPRTASADPAAPGFLPADPADTAPRGEETADAAASSLVPPPAPPAPSGTDPDEVAAWRARQDEWREQRDAWRRQQAERDATARAQARIERETVGRAFAAEAEARRRARQAASPRASAVFVLAVLGAGLVIGAITALAVAGSAAGIGVAAAAGILSAALVCALGMIVAGAIRRRSGFLAFATMTLVAAGVITGAFTAVGTVILGGYISNQPDTAGVYIQPAGQTGISVNPDAGPGGRSAPVTLRKGSGSTEIIVNPGTTLQLDAHLGSGTVSFVRVDPKGAVGDSGEIAPATGRQFRWTVQNREPEGGAPVIVPVHIDQDSGDIRVTVQER